VPSVRKFAERKCGEKTSIYKGVSGDLEQFFEWLKRRMVDWDTPFRIQRIDLWSLSIIWLDR
jgi:hypothetical protein